MIPKLDGYNKLVEIIRFDLRHKGYAKCLEFVDTGEEIHATKAERQKRHLDNIRGGESEALKEQRYRITNPITRCALEPAYAYDEETWRTDGIKKKVEHPDPTLLQRITGKMNDFYNGKDIHRYLHETVYYLNKFDPNAWLLLEKQTVMQGSTAEDVRIYPLEISSKEAINFEIDENGNPKWLAFEFKRVEMVQEGNVMISVQLSDFYFYSVDPDSFGYIWHFAEYDERTFNTTSSRYQEYDLITIESKTTRSFFVKAFDNNTTEVPAFCVGAFPSDADNREVFELFAQPAVPLLISLMQNTSVFDVTKTAFAFPKEKEYVKRCNNKDDTGTECVGGFFGGVYSAENRCGSCNGSGYIGTSSEQTTIRIPLPRDPAEILDLSKLSHLQERPIDLLNFQDAQQDKLQMKVSQAIYNQEQFQNKPSGSVTATQYIVNYNRVYNKHSAVVEVIIKGFKLFHRIAFQYFDIGNNRVSEKAVIDMSYPYDFKLKSILELLAEYKEANGLPDVQRSIRLDIMQKQHRNDPDTVANVKAFELWKPFKDKSPEDVAMILTTRKDTDRDKVLWENFDRIVTEIQFKSLNTVPFYKLSIDRQRQLIDAKITLLRAEIQYRSTVENDFEDIEFSAPEPSELELQNELNA